MSPDRRRPLQLARRLAPALSAVALLAGCAKPLPVGLFVGDLVEVPCCGHADEPIEIRFLGVAGWLIRKGSTAILTAPLYSNPDLVTTGLRTIRADPERIDRHLPDVSDVAAILVGHAHYDHLMDVPYIARYKAPNAVIYGNETMGHQLAPFGLPANDVRVIPRSEQGDRTREGRWYPVGTSARIMALRSDHAPHFAGVTLYSGVRSQDMEHEPETATEWLEGNTVAFLIDLLNRDRSVALRIYFQDAIPAPPFGLVPDTTVGQGIDVALIVPATYAEVSWHPEALLENAKPRHILLGHWENFFQPPDHPTAVVPFTDLGDFVQRLERALPDGSGWNIPMPGTRFRFN